MAYSVALYFDPETESAIQALVQALDRQGVGGTINDYDIRPHLTLATLELPDSAALERLAAGFAAGPAPQALSLDYLGIFRSTGQDDNNVLFLAPIPTQALLEYHSRFYRQAGQAGLLGAANPLYQPDRWVPHASLALSVSLEDLPLAVQTSLQSQALRPALLTALAVISHPPIQEVGIYPLSA